MYRQGDVWIEEVKQMPAGLDSVPRENGKLVLAHGEVTGHMHAIAEMDAEMFTEKDGTLYLRAPSGCTVTHQEHAPVTLPAGKTYRVIRQREYTSGMVQKVLD